MNTRSLARYFLTDFWKDHKSLYKLSWFVLTFYFWEFVRTGGFSLVAFCSGYSGSDTLVAVWCKVCIALSPSTGSVPGRSIVSVVISKLGSGSTLLPMVLVLASHLLLKDPRLEWCILEANRTVNNQGACSINVVMFCPLGLINKQVVLHGKLCWSC